MPIQLTLTLVEVMTLEVTEIFEAGGEESGERLHSPPGITIVAGALSHKKPIWREEKSSRSV